MSAMCQLCGAEAVERQLCARHLALVATIAADAERKLEDLTSGDASRVLGGAS